MDDLAYPCQPRDNYGNPSVSYQLGLSKRELFAAMAMQGYMANPHISALRHCATTAAAAEAAVESADALIAELSKEPT